MGITDEFSNNESWKLIPYDYEFINPANPLQEEIPEYVIIEGFNGYSRVDFKGIKIGDVNGSALPGQDQLDGRMNDPVTLYATPENGPVGEMVAVPVILENTSRLNGLQFTFEFDPQHFEFFTIEGDYLNISERNYGLSLAHKGMITFSWNTVEPQLVEEKTNLFTIKLIAKSQYGIGKLRLSDAILKAEWYENDQVIRDITCRFGKNEPFTLYQNTPNPWSNTTEFIYKLPQQSMVHINIRNIYGSLIKRYDVISEKGFNAFVIDQNDFEEAGLLIFEIEYKGVTETRKMIKIN